MRLLLALLSTAAALSPSTLDRRNAKFGAAGLATTLAPPAIAAAPATVFVAGATGQTGRRVLERLAAKGGSVVAGVRDTKKAEKTSPRPTVVRGAMVQKVDAVDTKGVRLAKLDVVAMSVDDMAAALSGSDALVIATLRARQSPEDARAHAVDNLGTVRWWTRRRRLRRSMVSSILTNGRAWGQENSPGGTARVLDEKIVAEKYAGFGLYRGLKASRRAVKVRRRTEAGEVSAAARPGLVRRQVDEEGEGDASAGGSTIRARRPLAAIAGYNDFISRVFLPTAGGVGGVG